MSQIFHSNANSEHNSRQVLIEVTGVRFPELKRRSNYTVKVPYYRLSTTVQQINRLGGRIVSVKVLSSVLPETESKLPVNQTTVADSPVPAPSTESAVMTPPPISAIVTPEKEKEETVIFPSSQSTVTETISTSKTSQKYRKSSIIRQRKPSTIAKNKLNKMTRRMKKLKTRRSKRKLTTA